MTDQQWFTENPGETFRLREVTDLESGLYPGAKRVVVYPDGRKEFVSTDEVENNVRPPFENNVRTPDPEPEPTPEPDDEAPPWGFTGAPWETSK
ncbi:hypothetical protein [Ruegeria sp. Alg231-54]|uniref:hypothetical protein n=1 Tax=Ruegeria sp. Alg231-54 TaxID=1922221 RepID=UPI000D54C3F1|nr:hypothetical protein [Ruegeria sp. Alg231-54]